MTPTADHPTDVRSIESTRHGQHVGCVDEAAVRLRCERRRFVGRVTCDEGSVDTAGGATQRSVPPGERVSTNWSPTISSFRFPRCGSRCTDCRPTARAVNDVLERAGALFTSCRHRRARG